MSRLALLFERRRFGVGVLAATIALVLVIGLQFWWLFELQATSVAAGNAALNGFLDSVTREVMYSYGPVAERILDVPSSYFTANRLAKSAYHFRNRDAEGAKRLFVLRFTDAEQESVLFYHAETDSMVLADPSDETRAVTVASTPWKLMHANAIRVESPGLVVEERDARNRVILNPITDPASRIVGVAGMLLDVEHFTRRLVPSVVADALERSFPEGTDDFIVTVRDEDGEIRFSTDPSDHRPARLTRSFPFVFTDHVLGIRSRGLTPGQLARVSFLFNVGLSVLAATLLVGGLLLVLRTATREVRLSRMKSDFVSNVTHELRTPLASIRVFGEFLRLGRATSPEKVAEYGEYIETECRRLTRLVDNILDFARIESGRKSYSFASGDVGRVLAATLRTFEVRSRHDGFVIDFDEPSQDIPPVRIDPDALGQAFHNLLDNAMNYSDDSRWIGVRLAVRDEEIVVSFEDRGRGIAAEEQKKIFDRFHRADTGLVHDVRGSGLGLSIVRHVVQAHSGRVTLDSEPGRGSVFSIHLPIEAAGG